MTDHWADIADLPLVVEACVYGRLDPGPGSGDAHSSRLVRLIGNGHEGIGEDITLFMTEEVPDLPLAGEWTLGAFCTHVDTLEQWLEPPLEHGDMVRRFRNWAYESAALDLALAQWLAGLGYLALAPDLYHRTAPMVELPEGPQGRERGMELMHRMTREQVLDDVHAATDHLRVRGSKRIGMVGLSVGGHVAYLAATEIDLAAVAVLYGGWIPTTDIPISRPEATLTRTASITARMLILVGENDDIVPPKYRSAIADALRAARIRNELVEYPNAPHGFLCDRRATYNPAAATDAWRRVEALLRDELR